MNFLIKENTKLNFLFVRKLARISQEKKSKNVLILVSNTRLRTKLIDIAKKNKIKILNAVHPSSVILKSSKLGVGVVIEPFVFVGYKAKIDDGVIIQQKSSVEHGTLIEKGVNINPNVMITRNCHIEKNVLYTLEVSSQIILKLKKFYYWSRT